MSDDLPSISGREAIAAFGRVGFVVARIEGSHHIMKRPGHRWVLSIPVHGNKPLKKGLLRGLIRAADLTVDQFCDLL